MKINLPGVHRSVTSARLKGGRVKRYTHYYAWRGGPRIKGDPGSEEFLEHYKDLTRYAGSRRAVPEEAKRLDKLRRNAMSRCKHSGREFNLTLAFLTDLLEMQKFRCAVTGIEFSESYESDHTSRGPYSFSIDRIDSKKGYTPGNVRLVLLSVNIALNEWGEEHFLKIAEAALEKRKGQPLPHVTGERV